jgi:hypothetical protein
MKKDACFHAALGYLDRGWAALALCPPGHQDVTDYHRTTCQSPGKRPLGRWKGWQSRLPTMEELAAQWEAVPRANVGVVTGRVSGLVGIDVDGPDGEQLLQEASSEEGTPGTLAFRTARGLRLLYSIEAGTTVRSWSVRSDGSEVKVLGEGGLTVMPPSRHSSGVTYRWLRRHGPGHASLALAPAWVLRPQGPPAENVRTPGRQRTRLALNGTLTAGGLIPEGQRNETLFRMGCAMRAAGGTVAEIYQHLAVINRRCLPPVNSDELRGIARSAARYPPRRSQWAD